jgi:hypothetical protein
LSRSRLRIPFSLARCCSFFAGASASAAERRGNVSEISQLREGAWALTCLDVHEILAISQLAAHRVKIASQREALLTKNQVARDLRQN